MNKTSVIYIFQLAKGLAHWIPAWTDFEKTSPALRLSFVHLQVNYIIESLRNDQGKTSHLMKGFKNNQEKSYPVLR